MNIKAAIAISLAAFSSAYGSIGKMLEVTGPTQIVRGKDKIEGKVNVEVEMNDSVETLKSRVSITFEDNTRMQVTEFSKLKIDEFVYDSKTGKGSLGIKAAFGTVRYASGAIAKNSRENVKVQTPTAKVSVRGTDFSMTVSEDGKSLIVLLPSIPNAAGEKAIVGEIEVSNMSGTVLMTKAYQATFVSSANTAPTPPIILDFQDESKINNMLMVETPKQVTQAVKEQKKDKQSQSTSDNEDNKPKKSAAKADAKVAVSQIDTPANNEPVAKAEDIPAVETKLDLSSIQPQVMQAVAEAISKTIAPAAPAVSVIAVEPPTNMIVSATVNTGWSTDGVNATLYIDSSGNIIRYSTKANISATVEVTNGEGAKTYPLNFGDKLNVKIIQKK